MTRTSLRIVFALPTRSNSCSSSTRSSFGWRSSGRSPISSRSRVPPCASSKRPILRAMAPVKAPRSWPKSSLSRRPAGMAVQLNLTNGRARRALSVWIRPPISSLPVPVSPRMRTAASVVATISARRMTRRSARLPPTIPWIEAGFDGSSPGSTVRPTSAQRLGVILGSSVKAVGSAIADVSRVVVMVPPPSLGRDSMVIAVSANRPRDLEQLLEDAQQRRCADRLAQELDRSGRPCPPLLVVAGPAGEEYDRDSHAALGEATLDLQAVHVRHANVQHEACGSRRRSGGQKLFPGGERLGARSEGPDRSEEHTSELQS